MGKHETIADGPSLSGGDTAVPVLENDAGVSPKMALVPDLTPNLDAAKLTAPKPEASKLEAPKPEAAKPQAPEMPKIAAPASDIPRIEIHAPAAAPRKAELASVEAPRIAPDIDDPKPAAPQAEAGAGDAGNAPAAEGTGPRVSRFTLLAASLALAAALGGMAGALAAYGLARPAPLPAVATGQNKLAEV